MFDELAGINMSRYFLAIGIVSFGLLALYAVLWAIRNRPSSPFVFGGRERIARLAVVDAAAVDTRRRIVLVRRDNVEHLIMIGGPTDIVIESRIVDNPDVAAPALPKPDAQASLMAPKIPLGLAPPRFATDNETRPSIQSQSSPPIRSQMVPAEPKSFKVAESDTEQAGKAKPISVPAAAAVMARGSDADIEATKPLRSEPVASLDGAQPPKSATDDQDIEFRNPYLETETALPVPSASKPGQDDLPATDQAIATAAPDTQPMSDDTVSVPPVMDDDKAGDLLDAARKRVLLSDTIPSAQSGSPQTEMMTGSEPKPEIAQSDFDKILDEEIKTGLPESRFDQPRRETGVSTGKGSETENNVPTTAAVKTIGEILNRARSRMMEPIAFPEAEQGAVGLPETVTEKKTDRKEKTSADRISNELEAAFEKIWDEPTSNRSPGASSPDKDNWDEDPFLWKPTPDDPRPDFLGRDLPQTDNRIPGRHLNKPLTVRDLLEQKKR
jgi:Flagellar biosynthesis protein, FliO